MDERTQKAIAALSKAGDRGMNPQAIGRAAIKGEKRHTPLAEKECIGSEISAALERDGLVYRVQGRVMLRRHLRR